MKFRLLLVLFLATLSSVWANDSFVTGISGSIAPLKSHPTIRMISEQVDAKVGWDTATVRCRFVFKNEGKATTVKMGFPEHATGDVGPIKKPAFLSFKSWVDGKPTKTRFVPSREKEDAGVTYHAWHVKEVAFATGQTRVVVNEYKSPLGEDSVGGRFFEYVLVTGKSWRGTIGEAIITVDVSEPSVFYNIEPRPKGFTKKDGKLEWRFSNFEPQEDVFVYLNPPEIYFNGKRIMPIEPVRDGVLMVPARSMTDDISWNAERKEYTIALGGRSLRVTVGSKRAWLDESEVELPKAPYIHTWSQQLAIPIMAVVRLMGGTAEWDPGHTKLTLIVAN